MVSVHNIPHQGYYVVLRHEYVDLTGSVIAAQVLGLLETWTKARDIEITRTIAFNQNNPDETKPIPDMWLYEKVQHFQQWLPWVKSDKTIRSALNTLCDLGVVEKRKQQLSSNTWDKTLEFRLNVEILAEKLNEMHSAKTTASKRQKLPDATATTTAPNGNDYRSVPVTATAPNGNGYRTQRQSLPDDYINNQSNDQISNNQSKNLFLKSENEKNDFWVNSDFREEEEAQSDPVVETDIIFSSGHTKNSGEDQFSGGVLQNEVHQTTKLVNYDDAVQCRYELTRIGARTDAGYNPGFLEAVRQHLNKSDYYKGKATIHHAQAYCKKNYNYDPSALLAIAQSALENPRTETGLTDDVMAAIEAGMKGEF